jgi:hypothetical protein
MRKASISCIVVRHASPIEDRKTRGKKGEKRRGHAGMSKYIIILSERWGGM